MNDPSVEVSPVTLDGFVLEAVQATSPTLSYLHTQNVTHALGTEDTSVQNSGPAASVSISDAAHFYSELLQLQTQDSARYTQVLTDIVGKLATASQNSAGEEQLWLSHLKETFQQAANGDLSVLQPAAHSVGNDLLPPHLTPVSTLGALLSSHSQNVVNTDVLAVQLQQAALGDLVAPQTAHAAQTTASVNLLATQTPQEATIGDLFLPQAPHLINPHGVVAVYGHDGQLLSEAFSTQEGTYTHPPFSAGTQQALDDIVNELHSALFNSSK